ncbi:histidinol-phosphatase [Chryseobacterium sp. TY3]
MRKVLFIDRDGTLILEPEDYQVDSFEKLEFYPKVFTYLGKIANELDFELVMVTNQDGLGTEAHPEENFWPVQNFVVKAFENENVKFEAIYIDKTFAHENAPTRKPLTGLLTNYIKNADFDLTNSFVIGDRITDVKLAQNLGSKAIFIANDESLGAKDIEQNENLDDVIALKTTSWKAIYEFLKLKNRTASIEIKTHETKIKIELNLDGTGRSEISTGLHFFDHMLDQIARHGQMDLKIKVDGDLQVDEHHTIEDTAIALGEVLMCNFSEEGNVDCLGIFPIKGKKFPARDIVPHMGWNTIYDFQNMIYNRPAKLFNNINENSDVYYVHSYYCELSNFTIATTTYIIEFSAALNKDNFYATQFHPEKSAGSGEQILKNFLEI